MKNRNRPVDLESRIIDAIRSSRRMTRRQRRECEDDVMLAAMMSQASENLVADWIASLKPSPGFEAKVTEALVEAPRSKLAQRRAARRDASEISFTRQRTPLIARLVMPVVLAMLGLGVVGVATAKQGVLGEIRRTVARAVAPPEADPLVQNAEPRKKTKRPSRVADHPELGAPLTQNSTSANDLAFGTGSDQTCSQIPCTDSRGADAGDGATVSGAPPERYNQASPTPGPSPSPSPSPSPTPSPGPSQDPTSPPSSESPQTEKQPGETSRGDATSGDPTPAPSRSCDSSPSLSTPEPSPGGSHC